MQTIILASQSPRRKELLAMLSVPFTVQESRIDERALDAADTLAGIRRTPAQKAAAMAEAKGLDVSRTAPVDSIIIAADTIVAQGEEILHKPKDAVDAIQMLHRLSGNTHTVHTGMSVIYKSEQNEIVHTSVSSTQVVFRPLTDAEIRAYVATEEPLDKAGAYGIQGKGAFCVERLEGDYYTVVGLPLTKLYLELWENGVCLTDFWQSSPSRLDTNQIQSY